MNNQPDDIADLKEEMEILDYRLTRIERFLSSFEPASEPPPILDERFMEVLRLLKDQERVTASMLQRHLHIGFTKAARIIDQLEFVGLVSTPGDPTKPRDVYRDKIKDYLGEIE